MIRCVAVHYNGPRCIQTADIITWEQLLDEPDWDIYYWATSKRTPPERWAASPLLEKLRVHSKNEGKVVRKMPAL
jgi:succinate dehydrogenase assembly factor 2